MDASLLQELRDRRSSIRKVWLTLLRAGPVATPIGHLETLSHMIDRTLTEVFAELSRGAAASGAGPSHTYDEIRRECSCGRSPLLEYFLAGERAILEALVQVQAARARSDGAGNRTEVAELYLTLRGIARREVRTFCSICAYGNSGRAPADPPVRAARTTRRVKRFACRAAPAVPSGSHRSNSVSAAAKRQIQPIFVPPAGSEPAGT
ncbi:MAG: hypothetical protein ACREFX_14770 [Opitutaceae bacterium]